MKRRFGEALRELHDGRMTMADFFRQTDGAWRRMARYLLRRWSCPAWVDEDEVVQELQLGATLSVWCYSEYLARGKTLAEYVEWNAIDYAKKRLHQMRGAKRSGNADAHPSRFETPLSCYSSWEWVEGLARIDAPQHRALEIKEAIERVCTSVRERHAIEAFLSQGDVVRGACALFEDAEMRKVCGLVRPRDAGRLVASAAAALAQQLDAA